MFSDMSVQWLVLLILLVSTAFIYTTNLILRKENRIPEPRGWPVIGHLPLLQPKIVHRTLMNIAQKYGPLYKLRLGMLKVLVISSPDLAKEILKIQDASFADRPFTVVGELFSYQLKGIIFSPTDDHWRFMRKLGSELMSSKAIQKQQVSRHETLMTAVNSLLERQGKQFIDLREELLDMMLTLMLQMLLGKRLTAGKSVAKSSESNGMKKLTQLYKELAKLDLFVMGDCFPFLRWLDVGGVEARVAKLHRGFDNCLSDAMNALRREAPHATSEDPGLMQTLLSMQRTEEGKNITDDEIKALVTDLLIAGIDTTANTIVFGMAELMRNPDVKEKLLKELDEFVGRERVVEESDLVNLKYLKMVIKETFRLHPPVPVLLPRKSMERATVAGYKIPKNSQVLINSYAIQRSPESWDDPTSFKPERFANNPIDVKGQDFCLLPFGAGRRQCPGMGIGGLMVEITLATFLQILEFSLPAGMKPEDVDMAEQATISSSLVSPLLVSVKPRLSPNLCSMRT
ncbi:protein MpCYP829-like23 [Marchantia polymorpha subsp. ruderalis]|uniref:Cytochrome P450 n=2 Tax=Marchantia polymorpha TaxID=3197 RepID=A0A176WE48_MARPO|nr:hypothetical protein AXG93_3890s1070 [Marchantia polymorpha subsp. ruderalis]PTQ44115.1 hypothetical protein MARPO_0022s0193 [Marchantia polymorpha]BBN04290.1 hypothetical protein Mp_3g03390 [Marchantia polymorpha subsp. ruderalis]|eukprot:PTQ44115.1 hypothetical protein MARPO_0022s0193 [Marchantia polymorpha]